MALPGCLHRLLKKNLRAPRIQLPTCALLMYGNSTRTSLTSGTDPPGNSRRLRANARAAAKESRPHAEGSGTKRLLLVWDRASFGPSTAGGGRRLQPAAGGRGCPLKSRAKTKVVSTASSRPPQSGNPFAIVVRPVFATDGGNVRTWPTCFGGARSLSRARLRARPLASHRARPHAAETERPIHFFPLACEYEKPRTGLSETRSTTPEAHQPSEPGRSAARLLSRAAAAAG